MHVKLWIIWLEFPILDHVTVMSRFVSALFQRQVKFMGFLTSFQDPVSDIITNAHRLKCFSAFLNAFFDLLAECFFGRLELNIHR